MRLGLGPTENSTTQETDVTSTQERNAISDPRNATSVTPLVLSDDLQRVHDNLSASSRLFTMGLAMKIN
ncbi:12233_t:CDS:2 [Rhizophagus irregularis]|nr:12233_t:CDS:2 [Rhizophagus irregularis]